MIVNPDAGLSTKKITGKHFKTSETHKRQQPTDNQKNIKYRNISKVWARFLLLTCSHPFPLLFTPLIRAVTQH